MKYSLGSRLFLFKRDVSFMMGEHRNEVIGGAVFLLFGVGFGIYIGAKVGAKDAPFGIFANLFCLNYAPFSFIVPDFLRFLLFSVVSALSFLLPLPSIYPVVALFFFGKYFGELACVCFLSDSFLAFLLSVLIVYLPLLFFGGSGILLIGLFGKGSRILNGGDPCLKGIVRELIRLGICLAVYFALLFFIYVILCGALYLMMIAL